MASLHTCVTGKPGADSAFLYATAFILKIDVECVNRPSLKKVKKQGKTPKFGEESRRTEARRRSVVISCMQLLGHLSALVCIEPAFVERATTDLAEIPLAEKLGALRTPVRLALTDQMRRFTSQEIAGAIRVRGAGLRLVADRKRS